MNLIKSKKNIFFLLIIFKISAVSQNLDSLLNANEKKIKEINYVYATFKGTKLINGQSIELVAKKEMQIMFQHRFGPMNNGLYDFIGLDLATIRIGIDYGLAPRLNIGLGRSTNQKAIDGFLKYKLSKQSNTIPFSAVLFTSLAINTIKFPTDANQHQFSERINYCLQFLIARKFTGSLSMQLTPTLIHRNLVLKQTTDNTIFAIGYGIRYKISKRIAILGEYFLIPFSHLDTEASRHTLAIGLDIDTGGHIFQLHFTNAEGMIESQFIGLNDAGIRHGLKSIRLGFNLNRVFSIGKKIKK